MRDIDDSDEPPPQVWLVRPKSDARWCYVLETFEEADREAREGRAMAGPYVLEDRQEVAWLDERIAIVRDLAKQGLDGFSDPISALHAIVQQLTGVSRTTSAKP